MMNVLRDGRSERGTARVGKRHDLKTVRWYVLTLRPTTGVARRDRISPAKSLMPSFPGASVGETLFEYFAPSYVEVRKVDGKMVNTKRPPAVQLRVYPVLRGGDLPDEAYASPIQFPSPGLFRRHDSFPLISRMTRWVIYVGWLNLIPTSFRCTFLTAIA